MRDSLGSGLTIVSVIAPLVAVLFVQTPPQARSLASTHCGIVYHLADGSTDAVQAQYRDGTFAPDSNSALPFGHRLSGRSSLGKSVEVLVDSATSGDEPFASEYHARVLSATSLDSSEVVVFCDPPLPIRIQTTKVGPLDSASARAVRLKIRTLHDRALAYDPEVLEHDSLDFRTPTVLQPTIAPNILIVSYGITLRLKRALHRPSDDRASGFAIYSISTHRVLYGAFGHPEWAPTAETVTAVYPRLLFTIQGDSHLYLLAVYYGPWESGAGQWVIFDANSGAPITAPDLRSGGRYR